MATAASSGLHYCEFCSFRSIVKSDVMKHLKESHVQEPGFHMNCKVCGRSFRVFSSFSSHVSHSHPGTLAENAYENKKSIR
jgi:uncharacterized C2H2 Zn-finger protein